jgi:site-specific DNA recombinase
VAGRRQYAEMPRKALGCVRLSHLTNATTSPNTQRALVDSMVGPDLEIADWAEDLDISAADYSPKDRPALGPWLTNPELIEKYDVIVWASLDRGIRSVADLRWLLDFCKDYDKELIFAKEKLDTSTPVGRIIATLLAAMAEIEIANMVERRERASAHLRTTNRWPGGPAPYGYDAVDASDGKGKVLVISEPEAIILREIVSRVITDADAAPESLAEIARDLNARGIPTSRERIANSRRGTLIVKGWSNQVINRILRSRAMLGQKEQQLLDENGYARKERRLLLDASGRPIQMAPGIITLEDFQRVQAALDRAARPRPSGTVPNPLSGVLVCGECGNPLRKHGPKNRPQHTHKFRCYGEGCRRTALYVDDVWAVLQDTFIAAMGSSPVMRREYRPGEDHRAEIEDLQKRIKDLRDARYVRGEFDGEEEAWSALMATLQARKKELSALPQRKGEWVYVPESKMYAEIWQGLDMAGRGMLLKRAGIKVALFPSDGREVHMRLEAPEDVLQRLG